MRVLITNMKMAGFSGSEVAAELAADGLRRAGHETVIYAPARESRPSECGCGDMWSPIV